MYKKLMFLISFVMLLGLSSPVLSADFEVDWGETYIVSGTEEYGDMECGGCVIIPAGATLILNSESTIDGDGGDGEGGSEYAKVIVDGGTFIMNERINLGTDHDAYIIVQNGGSMINTDEKICIPDNDGGVHRLIVIDGTVDATDGGIELDERSERSASIQLACSTVPGVIVAKITTGNTDDGDRWDPSVWITRGPNEGGIYDYPEGSCSGAILTIVDLGNDVKEVFYFLPPDHAWGPTPQDGAVEQSVDVILCWKDGNFAFRNSAYLGTDPVAVENAGLADFESKGYYEPEGVGPGECLDPDLALKNPITLQLWETYYWRIDTVHIPGSPTPATTKGHVWSFTTGCELFEGDINLDCIVNSSDYVMLADDWREEVWFPADVQP